MASASTRSDIVLRALKLAGRGVELRALAIDLLNDMLRQWSREHKYPELKKVGSALSLAQGSQTSALPADFGAGIDNLVFGPEGSPLDEVDMDDFIARGGMSIQPGTTGRPTCYTVDKNAGVFRFDRPADQAYNFTPIYYQVAPRLPTDSTGDNLNVFHSNDALVVQGLVEAIYQYTVDDREFTQHQKVEAMQAADRRGTVAMTGGPNRIKLSSKFRNNR